METTTQRECIIASVFEPIENSEDNYNRFRQLLTELATLCKTRPVLEFNRSKPWSGVIDVKCSDGISKRAVVIVGAVAFLDAFGIS